MLGKPGQRPGFVDTAGGNFLAGAIDKLLGLIQSIYSGILTFVSMVVSGEFEEIIRRLGYLVSAAKTVPDVFEQAAADPLPAPGFAHDDLGKFGLRHRVARPRRHLQAGHTGHHPVALGNVDGFRCILTRQPGGDVGRGVIGPQSSTDRCCGKIPLPPARCSQPTAARCCRRRKCWFRSRR